MALDDSSDAHIAKVNDFIRSNLGDVMREVSRGARASVASMLGKQQLTVFERLPCDGPHQPRKWDTPLRPWDLKLGKF